MKKVLVIGSLTKDKIFFGKELRRVSVGGSVFYCGETLHHLGVDTAVACTLSKKDKNLLDEFSDGIKIESIYKKDTASFELRYSRKDLYSRKQITQTSANPILIQDIKEIDISQYSAVLLGPQYSNDFPLSTIKHIFRQNKNIFLYAQGFLRKIVNNEIINDNWEKYREFLPSIRVVFLKEDEICSMFSCNSDLIGDSIKKISSHGPSEIIVKRPRDYLVYFKDKNEFYEIPLFYSGVINDYTGAGGTFLAAYLAGRLDGKDAEESAEFASMAVSIKLKHRGYFKNKKRDIVNRLNIKKFLNIVERGKKRFLTPQS